MIPLERVAAHSKALLVAVDEVERFNAATACDASELERLRVAILAAQAGLLAELEHLEEPYRDAAAKEAAYADELLAVLDRVEARSTEPQA
jgi:hypothetical protein